jgi:hypothetical protein
VRLALLCAATALTLIVVDAASAPDVYRLPGVIAGARTPLALGGALFVVGVLWLGVGAVVGRRTRGPRS